MSVSFQCIHAVEGILCRTACVEIFVDICVCCRQLFGAWLTTLPYLTFGVGRLLHLPSAEAVSVRPNVQPRCNQKVTVTENQLWSRTNHQQPGTGDV